MYFLNAVYCVGNYSGIFSEGGDNRGMNQINDGTSGMLYATPYGKRANNKDDFLEGIDDTAAIALDRIEEQGWLNCGVVVPDGFNGEIATSDKLVGMSVDYCRTLAAALFNGNYNAVMLFTFLDTDDSSFLALKNGTIDVLAGRRIEKVHDFGGFHFSTPYYYGNETAG